MFSMTNDIYIVVLRWLINYLVDLPPTLSGEKLSIDCTLTTDGKIAQPPYFRVSDEAFLKIMQSNSLLHSSSG